VRQMLTPALALALLAAFAAAAGVVDLGAVLANARASGPAAVRRRWAAGVVGALKRIGARVGAPAAPASLATRIEAAGRPLHLGVADVMAVKGGGALVALVGGAPVAAALPGRLPLLAALAFPAAGFLAPDLLLARRARRRGRAMAEELPDLLDLLRVAVQAGLPLGRAVAEVGTRHGGTLAAEWRRAAAELALGVPRDRVLKALLRRCPATGMGALVAAIERAERHGSPLADTLDAQARQARAERARRVRDRAARAAPKIQLVIALLLVPSILLLVAAALVASLMR
jgi:tight adherence protein C